MGRMTPAGVILAAHGRALRLWLAERLLLLRIYIYFVGFALRFAYRYLDAPPSSLRGRLRLTWWGLLLVLWLPARGTRRPRPRGDE